ncbi:hypothetical protein FH972_026875 [Carpinus fangiana]|uniref:CASP-like protein n=1 Tax=Carpinus fangiana TaxID=176857 RepID=A0A5N6L5D1_9ROSI|nr:hypothetical protein FH972_026875 [Carpinus fangiana]
MGIKSKVEQKSTALSYIAKAVARTLQFALAVAVAGLYGYRLSADRSTGDETPHKWIYAEVVAGMSAATAIIYMIPFVKTHVLFVWDMTLFHLPPPRRRQPVPEHQHRSHAGCRVAGLDQHDSLVRHGRVRRGHIPPGQEEEDVAHGQSFGLGILGLVVQQPAAIQLDL